MKTLFSPLKIFIKNATWYNRFCEIGYWIAEDSQGKGIVTKSCQALINYAFKDLQFHRIVIRCMTNNEKSRRIPERLGFKIEGTERESQWLYDHFVDLIVYSLISSDISD